MVSIFNRQLRFHFLQTAADLKGSCGVESEGDWRERFDVNQRLLRKWKVLLCENLWLLQDSCHDFLRLLLLSKEKFMETHCFLCTRWSSPACSWRGTNFSLNYLLLRSAVGWSHFNLLPITKIDFWADPSILHTCCCLRRSSGANNMRRALSGTPAAQIYWH